MPDTSSTTLKMPELLVFTRAILLGAVLFEIFWVALLATEPFGRWLYARNGIGLAIVAWTLAIFFIGAYGRKRGVYDHAKRIYEGRRLDLLLLTVLGAVAACMLEPQLAKFHTAVGRAGAGWAPVAFGVLLLMLVSPMWREFMRRKRPDTTQLYFLADAEIKDAEQDVLGVARQASEFADTVLTSGAHSGLVFGVDGPWGVGKTSFLNLAKKRWETEAGDSVIVFTFEPLRYASEPDLSERFIKDLCAAIQQKVFAPEFLPAATRYSRMLKGKTDFSLLGIKLSLEPSSETIDELLDDIDDLLKQIDRRLIVIVDDLDRLENKLVNNVLFTVRRTFKLTRATYILCYDTDTLIASATGKDDGARAREFLEKFITAKLSLFVDLKAIHDYLGTGWETKAIKSDTVSATAKGQLKRLMTATQALLKDKDGYRYGPLLGDMRKVKRFVNAALLMRMDTVRLDGTDFDERDLIHLMLLHLCYPGLFRRIYAEETEGHAGTFSAQQGDRSTHTGPINGSGLDEAIKHADPAAKFLLRQLFDVESWKPWTASNDETPWRTRACFNHPHRNLEKYLQLIVRLKVPEPRESYRLYKDLLQAVMDHQIKVADVLLRPDFALNISESAQDKFWTMVVNHAHALDRRAANDVIDTLVQWLPKYSSLQFSHYSMRHRAVVSLLFILDRAGFGELPGGDRVRDLADLPQLAIRLLGGGLSASSPSLIQQLVAPDRGALGWGDLMLLRLCCSADRQSSAHNIYTALARLEEPADKVTGNVEHIATRSMRRLSQRVFEEFRRNYIDARVNYFLEADRITDAQILGEGGHAILEDVKDLEAELKSSISGLKSFVMYQLINDRGGNGEGIGCGRYDEVGTLDGGGIRKAMTDYLLGFCFDPSYGLAHARAFADYCIRSLRDEPFEFIGVDNVEGTMKAVTKLLGRDAMVAFWTRSGDQIKKLLASARGTVYCYNNFKASYEDRIPTLFLAMDRLVKEPPLAAEPMPPAKSKSPL
ncbi:KAP family NTPase [Pelomonas sp. CA6]|uniref:P-loop NTPase fold protein n=1 Tax=Pelomonas sp. CA6 TaxID=2907999 RepID=UPI001F4A59B5|nr:P-loop NTPase fold protein [Pelomonas sp. CA6]MCH7342927.1 KAP family NTPase [Pelomonas sp. CA6]